MIKSKARCGHFVTRVFINCEATMETHGIMHGQNVIIIRLREKNVMVDFGQLVGQKVNS